MDVGAARRRGNKRLLVRPAAEPTGASSTSRVAVPTWRSGARAWSSPTSRQHSGKSPLARSPGAYRVSGAAVSMLRVCAGACPSSPATVSPATRACRTDSSTANATTLPPGRASRSRGLAHEKESRHRPMKVMLGLTFPGRPRGFLPGLAGCREIPHTAGLTRLGTVIRSRVRLETAAGRILGRWLGPSSPGIRHPEQLWAGNGRCRGSRLGNHCDDDGASRRVPVRSLCGQSHRGGPLAWDPADPADRYRACCRGSD